MPPARRNLWPDPRERDQLGHRGGDYVAVRRLTLQNHRVREHERGLAEKCDLAANRPDPWVRRGPWRTCSQREGSGRSQRIGEIAIADDDTRTSTIWMAKGSEARSRSPETQVGAREVGGSPQCLPAWAANAVVEGDNQTDRQLGERAEEGAEPARCAARLGG